MKMRGGHSSKASVEERRCHSGPRRRSIIAAACATVALTATGAAGATASAGASASHGSARSPQISKSTLVALRQEIAKDQKVPAWIDPGPPVDAAKARGKSLFLIPQTSAIGACTTNATDMKQLGATLGIKVTIYNNTGLTSQWVSGMDEAISEHYSAIGFLCGLNPVEITPQIRAANAAHIPVIGFQEGDPTSPVPQGLWGGTSTGNKLAMTVAIDDAIVHLNGRPLHAVMLASSGSLQTPSMVEAARAEVKRVCAAACSIDVVGVPIPEWATQTEETLASVLAKYPDTNAVIVQLDGQYEFALPAIVGSHIKNLHAYAFGGTPTNIKGMERPNSTLVLDSSSGNIWNAYSNMDQVLRAVTGMKPAPQSRAEAPLRFWTATNASQRFNASLGFGTAFLQSYRKLWGLKA